MLVKSILGVFGITLAVLAPVAAASGNSDKYDMYNRCGAPFCGSTGNAATAGSLVGDDAANVSSDKGDNEVVKTE